MHKSKTEWFLVLVRTKTDDNASYDVMSPIIYIKYLEEPRVHGLRKKKSVVYTIREGEEKQRCREKYKNY